MNTALYFRFIFLPRQWPSCHQWPNCDRTVKEAVGKPASPVLHISTVLKTTQQEPRQQQNKNFYLNTATSVTAGHAFPGLTPTTLCKLGWCEDIAGMFKQVGSGVYWTISSNPSTDMHLSSSRRHTIIVAMLKANISGSTFLTPTDSTRVQWTPSKSSGIHWTGSTGFHDPSESSGLHQSPLKSSVHWTPLDSIISKVKLFI